MNAPIWLVGEGRLKEVVCEWLSMDFKVANVHMFQDEESSPLALVSICDSRRLEEERKWQNWAMERKIPYLRVHLYMDRAFVGPWVLPFTAGCIQCAEWRMSLVHPHREIWSTLEQVQRNYQPGGDVKGWSIPFLHAIAGMIQEELEQLAIGKPLRLKQRVYVGYDHSLRGRTHSFTPNPTCSVCGRLPDDHRDRAWVRLKPRIKPHPRSYRLPNPRLNNETLKEKFYDWRMGIINHLYRDTQSKVLPICGAEMPLPDRQTTEIGFGRTHTFRESELTAVLEGLERYAGMMPRGKQTVHRGSYSDFQGDAIHPPDWGIHEKKQTEEPGYQYIPYDDDLEMNWVWGYSWRKKKPVLVPEQMVYYRLAETKEQPVNRFVYETSNGCAMGGSLEEAVFFALMEVIERDAFLVSWYNRLPLTHIDLAGVEDKNLLFIQDRVEALGYQLHLMDMTMESGVPSVWALLINPAEDAKVKTYSAAGAHPNPEKAIMGAMVEVVTSVPIYENIMPQQRERAAAMVKDGSQVQEMHDHVLLYSHPDTIHRFDFLFENIQKRSVRELYTNWYESQPPDDLTKELTALIERLLSYHQDIVIVDETPPELSEIGITAVKVFVNGMMTMSFGHQYRRIVVDRVQTAPLLIGARKKPIDEAEINPYPHPFP